VSFVLNEAGNGGGDYSEDLGVDGRIVLEWILGKWCGKLWIGFIWLSIGPVVVS
jgi:hypothetical protein